MRKERRNTKKEEGRGTWKGRWNAKSRSRKGRRRR